MTIFQEINKAWATLFGFKVENDEATFNDKPLYWNNNAVTNWDDLLSAKPSELKQSASVAESPNTKTYAELMTPENFSYGAFNWTNEHGTRLGFSLGNLDFDIQQEITYNYRIEAHNHGVLFNSYEGQYIYNEGLGFSGLDDNELYISLVGEGIGQDTDSITLDEYLRPDTNNYYFAFYMVRDNGAIVLIHDGNQFIKYGNWYSGDNHWNLWSNSNQYEDTLIIDGNTQVYFDDGAHLPEGITWNDELRSYFVPKVKETETTTILTETTATQAMQGAQIMTHATVWGMGIATACFIVGLFKLFSKFLNRR